MPDGNAKPTFTATSGRFGEATHVGQGIYLAEYTPGEAGDVSIKATLGSELQSDTDTLVLLPKRDGTSLQSDGWFASGPQRVTANSPDCLRYLGRGLRYRSSGLAEVRPALRPGGQFCVVKDGDVPELRGFEENAAAAGFYVVRREQIEAEGVKFTL